jgi:hypothetical protein
MKTLCYTQPVSRVVQLLIFVCLCICIIGVSPSRSAEKVFVSSFSEQNDVTMNTSEENNKSLRTLKAEEKTWYIKFHNGGFLFDGWKKLTQKILLNVPHDQKNETKNILHQLGEKIGSEWCRDNSIRKIDTEMLLKWGGNLKETLDSDPERITEAIRTIDTDVNKILLNDHDFST